MSGVVPKPLRGRLFIACSDNLLFLISIYINGQVIPFASVYMNVYESQDFVNQVNQEIKNGEKTKRATEYFDTTVERYELLKSQDNANYGNNRSASSRGRNVRMGNSILQKGRYYNSPSLYV